MTRPIGSLNKKGKQSKEERKAKRKASKKANSVESRQREYAKRSVERREKKIEKLNQRIREKRQQLHSVGRFAGAEDSLLKELAKFWVERLKVNLNTFRQMVTWIWTKLLTWLI